MQQLEKKKEERQEVQVVPEMKKRRVLTSSTSLSKPIKIKLKLKRKKKTSAKIDTADDDVIPNKNTNKSKKIKKHIFCIRDILLNIAPFLSIFNILKCVV